MKPLSSFKGGPMASKAYLEAFIDPLDQFSVFENIADGICVSTEGIIQFMNSYLEERFDKGTGIPFSEIFAGAKLKDEEGPLDKVSRYEWLSNKTGQTFEVINSPFKNQKGGASVLSLFIDITEQHRLQQRIEDYYTKLKETNRELKLVNKTLSTANRKLEELSTKDELTGLYNKRHFWDALAIEFKRAMRYSTPTSCLMIDIDLFKSVNDLGSHAFGDYCLSEIGRMIRSQLRAMDIAARYGGEEFAVILPSTDYRGARTISQKIRGKIEKRSFKRGEIIMNLTVSVGVSSMPEDKVNRHNRLVEFADKALYEAKMQGRNRVCLYRDIKLKDKGPKLGKEKIEEVGNRLFHLMEGVKRDYIEATKNLVQSLEFKDKYRQNHSIRVSRFASRIAEAINLSKEQIDSITFAALLHDLGFIGINNEILLKEGGLNKEEYDLVKEHPVLSAQMIQSIRDLQEEVHCVLHHHEWYNGKGYPGGLKGKEIPLGARVLAIADAYDAMRSHRPYRAPLSIEMIEKEFSSFSGSQFDPKLVGVMQRLLKEEGFIKNE